MTNQLNFSVNPEASASAHESGLDALTAICAEFPDARIIMLTTYTGDVQVLRAMKVGARAYLLKTLLDKELLGTIRAVHSGKKALSAEASYELAEHAADESLTPAEIAKVEREPFGGVPFGYYGASRARKLPLADFKALEQGVDFYPCVERLFDGFLKSQDAFLAFNLMDEPGTEYFPIAEATDEDIVRIDVIET